MIATARFAIRSCTFFALLVTLTSLSMAQTSTTIPSAELLAQLRQGGYVIFMRHPQTDKNSKDVDLQKLDDCATQRNLSDEGRTVSKTVGDAMRSLKIKVGKVYTSEFCRAKEAAKLMGFNEAKVTKNLNLCYNDAKLVIPVAENEKRVSEVRKIISKAPKKGSNTLIVSHRPNVEDAARMLDPNGKGFGDVAEAEMVVFQPQSGDPAYKYVGRIGAKQWTEWAAVASK